MEFSQLKLARVTAAHKVIYENPIRLRVGDQVLLEKWEPVDSEWAGWAFCVASNGIKGWVS